MVKILVDAQGIIKYQGHYDYILLENSVKAMSDANSVDFYICDMNEENSEIIELDNPIEGFIGCKFIYEEGEVIENPDYVEEE
jgi:hypothetical protein